MKNVFIAILDYPDATVDLEGRSEDIKACVISIVARVLMVLDLTGKACYLQTFGGSFSFVTRDVQRCWETCT